MIRRFDLGKIEQGTRLKFLIPKDILRIFINVGPAYRVIL